MPTLAEAEYEIQSVPDVAKSDSDEWEHNPPGERYGVDSWIHESGVVFAVRGVEKNRLTLHPPYDDIREVKELDGGYIEDARTKALILIHS